MKIGEVADHLGKRGFVTREKWCPEPTKPSSVLVFGMDNLAWICMRANDLVERRKEFWIPCLDDIWATDWIILPFFWNGSKDDFLPFEAER
jgi:hypothetical protein